jgi:hypothetical protein
MGTFRDMRHRRSRSASQQRFTSFLLSPRDPYVRGDRRLLSVLVARSALHTTRIRARRHRQDSRQE